MHYLCSTQSNPFVLALSVIFIPILIFFSFVFCVSFHHDSADEVLLKPTGAQLTVEFLEEHSFSVPVMVLRRDGLGMTLPPSSFCVSDVEHHIGKFGCKDLRCCEGYHTQEELIEMIFCLR